MAGVIMVGVPPEGARTAYFECGGALLQSYASLLEAATHFGHPPLGRLQMVVVCSEQCCRATNSSRLHHAFQQLYMFSTWA